MKKFLTFTSLCLASIVSAKHTPIRQDIVDDVRAHTDLWVAYDACDNPFCNKTVDELYNLAGTNKVIKNDKMVRQTKNYTIEKEFDVRK